MKIATYIIDTFTETKFRGNPTSVCISGTQLPSNIMHAIAVELGLPVTAFCVGSDIGKPLSIRYFTVTGEIPACGHATLATAWVVLEMFGAPTVKFKTIQGIILEAKQENGIIFLAYPKFEAQPHNVAGEVLDSLGLAEYKSVTFCAELETLFIELESAEVLRGIAPDFHRLVAGSPDIKEVVVTCASDDIKYDFLLRSFCPWIGIDEDPVTGSVHSVLAGFWKNKLGKQRLTAYQASRRGGVVYVESNDDTVAIGGHSVLVFKGEMTL